MRDTLVPARRMHGEDEERIAALVGRHTYEIKREGAKNSFVLTIEPSGQARLESLERIQALIKLNFGEHLNKVRDKKKLNPISLTTCQCGNELMPDAVFCRKCGTKRPTNDDATEPGATLDSSDGSKRHALKASSQDIAQERSAPAAEEVAPRAGKLDLDFSAGEKIGDIKFETHPSGQVEVLFVNRWQKDGWTVESLCAGAQTHSLACPGPPDELRFKLQPGGRLAHKGKKMTYAALPDGYLPLPPPEPRITVSVGELAGVWQCIWETSNRSEKQVLAIKPDGTATLQVEMRTVNGTDGVNVESATYTGTVAIERGMQDQNTLIFDGMSDDGSTPPVWEVYIVSSDGHVLQKEKDGVVVQLSGLRSSVLKHAQIMH